MSERLGTRSHRTCSAKEDLTRLVDVKAELDGNHNEAHMMAVEYVKVLNKLSPKNPMCDTTTF